MAHDNKVSMPSSMGGLTRYFDEYKSKISLKPAHIILLVIVVIILEIALHLYGGRFLQ
jgi:preprotein translocase subunit Sec61beta